MNRSLVEVDLSLHLISDQSGCGLWEDLPPRRLVKWQPAYRTPVKRSKGQLPPFVYRSEVGTVLASLNSRNNRIASPIIC